MKKFSKKETQDYVTDFFSNLKDKTPADFRKIKKFAMKHNIKLGPKKKMFCKKCFSLYKNPKVRINNKIKSVECENCGYKSGWKIDS